MLYWNLDQVKHSGMGRDCTFIQHWLSAECRILPFEVVRARNTLKCLRSANKCSLRELSQFNHHTSFNKKWVPVHSQSGSFKWAKSQEKKKSSNCGAILPNLSGQPVLVGRPIRSKYGSFSTIFHIFIPIFGVSRYSGSSKYVHLILTDKTEDAERIIPWRFGQQTSG